MSDKVDRLILLPLPNPQLLQLPRADFRRGFRHEVAAGSRLREGDDVANRRATEHFVSLRRADCQLNQFLDKHAIMLVSLFIGGSSQVELRNKPLIEALFEAKWRLEPAQDNALTKRAGRLVDRHFKLLPGVLSDRLKSYPFFEDLPISQIPEELTQYQVRHRFRTAENGWPLIQIGPGIATLNDTSGYIWEGFKPRAVELISVLRDVYKDDGFPIKSLVLRYIDSVDLDGGEADLAEFTKSKLKFHFRVEPILFSKARVEPNPLNFNFVAQFKPIDMPGRLDFRIATGTIEGSSDSSIKIIWQTTLTSDDQDLEGYESETMIEMWLEHAHTVLHEWFFAQIDGDLKARFV
ncbi:MAG TPA: TIGR04255 family protein [Candidatus Hodarchaeales archaeon]|nr:TIGR04255 family protein [Candidatus Hodarchaeales archaeon]